MVKEDSTPVPLSDIRPLVVGIEPFAGESLPSVLVRACEANVFTKTSHLLKLLGLHAQACEGVPFTQTGAAPALAKLLGTATGEIKSRMHPAAQDNLGRAPSVDWFGSSIERKHIEATVRRYAPRSLEEHAYNPAIWAVRLLDYCPSTMELLLSECVHCSRPLGWRACRALSKCEKCGASLLRVESRTVPGRLQDAARFGAALVSPTASTRQTALSSLPAPFASWAPADALVALVKLGEARLSLQPDSNSREAVGSAAHIAAGIEFTRDWPASMARFAKESTTRSNTTSLQFGLGPLGKLFQATATKSPIRDLIRSTISTSLGEAVVPAKLHSGGTVDGTCRHGMLTALEAAEQLGIGRKQLRRLEGRSGTFLARHNVKGGVALYDNAAVSRLQNVLSNSVKPASCARQLGIPCYCVEALTFAGLLEFVTNQDAMIVTRSTLIAKASITALRARLLQQSRSFQSKVTLREAMRRTGDPQDWVAIFENMLSGRIPFEIADCDSPSLSDTLLVEPTDIARYVSQRSTWPGISGINISCQAAAELLGTSPQFISAAVKAGLMEGKVGLRNSALPLERVFTFQKHYVLTEELRETFGAHQKSISCQLRKAGLKPAATISRTRVWLRSDIEKYRQNQNDCEAGR